MLESFVSDKFTYKKIPLEEQKARGILGRLTGVIADTKNPTRNGRAYSADLWKKVFDNDIMKEKIANRCVFSELGHPESREEIDLDKVCACLAEQPKLGSDGKLYGVFDILDTTNGRILKTLCDYGTTVGVSSRGTGDLYTDENGNEAVDPDTYNCECFDIVVVPAVKEARLQYVTESLGKKKYNKTLRQSLQESLDKADEKDKAIMNEALSNLGIKLKESSEEVYRSDKYLVKVDDIGDYDVYRLSDNKIVATYFDLDDVILDIDTNSVEEDLNKQEAYIPGFTDQDINNVLENIYDYLVLRGKKDLANKELDYLRDKGVSEEDIDAIVNNLTSIKKKEHNFTPLMGKCVEILSKYKKDSEFTDESLENESLEEVDPELKDYYEQELSKLYDTIYNVAKEADHDGAKKLSKLLQDLVDEIDLNDELITESEENQIMSYDEAKQYFKEKGLKLTKDVYNLILQINGKDNDMVQERLISKLRDSQELKEDALDDTGVSKAPAKEIADKMPNTKFTCDGHEVLGKDILDYFDPDEYLSITSDNVITGREVNEECNGESCSDKEDPEEVVNDKSEKELVAEFQESLQQIKKLDEDNLSLKEQLSVCIAKEKELQEQLAKYKQATVSLSDTAKEVKPLKESLDKKDNIIKANKTRISNLIESIKTKDSSLEEIIESKEQLDGQVKSLTEKLENNSKQLEDSKELVEKYRRSYSSLKENFIDAKAKYYGIKKEDLRKNINESVKLKELDSICEKLVEQRNKLDKLPIRINESTKINFSNTTDRLVERLNNNDDDYVSDLLKSMVN